MYTVWLRKFKVDRVLEPQERYEALPRNRSGRSNEHHCVISLNSTCLDVVDRRYRLRGTVATTVATLVCTMMALFGIWLLATWVPNARPDGKIDGWLVAIILVQFVGQFPVMWRYTFRRGDGRADICRRPLFRRCRQDPRDMGVHPALHG